jgi:2'-hydroxyisoflavone reductase
MPARPEPACARSSAPPAGTSFVAADRDADDGSRDRRVDTLRCGRRRVPATRPRMPRRPVRDLRSRHWVFVPSGNVYADFSTLEQDEDSALLAPLDGDVMESMEAYGPARSPARTPPQTPPRRSSARA